MADNRANTSVDMRTPRSRVEGLGAAGHGVEHWWQHRLTAVANVPLIIGFIVIVAMTAGRPHAEALRIVSHPLAAIILVLTMASVSNHMRLGLQIVIDDYVHERGLRLAATVANNFFAALIAVSTLFAILKIAFTRVI